MIGKGRNKRQLRLESLERRLCLAASVGWDGPGLGSAALSYYVAPVPAVMDLSQQEVESGLETALGVWASVANITFSESVSPKQPNSIDFTFISIDGSGDTLAQAYYPDDVNREPIAGDIEFDMAEGWEIGDALGGAATDLVFVAIHEIGHSLGLEHSDVFDSVMYPTISRTQVYEGLAESDVDAILALYAPAPAAPSLAYVRVDRTVIAENDTVTLSGAYSDPDSSHQVIIDWGDGSPETVAELDEATGTFDVVHQYLDDGASGTEADDYTISVRMEDPDSEIVDSATSVVTVENTRPRLEDMSVAPLEEGAIATLTATIDDPGSLDTFTVRVNWGDGSATQTYAYPAGTADFSETHVYVDDPGGTSDDEYEIMVIVADDDSESYIGLTTAAVANSDPELAIVGAPTLGWLGHAIELLAKVTDAGTEDFHSVRWNVTRDGFSYAEGVGTDFSFVPTQNGVYDVTVTVNDGDGGTGTSTASINVNADLGTIDFLTLDELSLAGEPLLLVFTTAHAGILTLETLDVDVTETVSISLFDQNPLAPGELTPVAQATDGARRIDHPTATLQTYYLQLDGASADFDLRITNLVSREGAVVSVSGTDDDDEFQFSAAAGRLIVINDVSYEFNEAEVTTVEFSGGDGYDRVTLQDSPGDDSLQAWSTTAVLSNGSEDEGADFTVSADAFEEMHVYARGGGHDTASLHDSEKNDKFKAEPDLDYAKMYGGAMYNRVKFFDVVEAISTGGSDLARIFDTAGDDAFEGQKDASQLYGTGFDIQAYGFGRVIAYASEGMDAAKFVDSALKDEFHAKPTKAELFDAATDGDNYRITVRRFDSVYAAATNSDGTSGAGGSDIAKIWPTAAADTIEAADDSFEFYRQDDSLELIYDVVAFETVRVRETTDDGDSASISEPLTYALLLDGGWE